MIAAILSVMSLLHQPAKGAVGRLGIRAQRILLGVACFANLMFYCFMIWMGFSPRCSGPEGNGERNAALGKSIDPPSANGHFSTPSAMILRPTSSPDKARGSWDFHAGLSKANYSQSELLGPPSSLSRASSMRSEGTAHTDLFDRWETSHASILMTDAASHIMPSRGTRLDTIHVGDVQPTKPTKTPESPCHKRVDAQVQSSCPPGSHSSVIPQGPRGKRSGMPLRLQVPDERLIHPLFRADSPTPPPLVSPDTMVIASPNAGQILPYPALPIPVSKQGSAAQIPCIRVQWRADRKDDLQLPACTA